ncbi:hypothetical protein ACWNX2_00760 [Candidatus Vidania fulgoroideorum]
MSKKAKQGITIASNTKIQYRSNLITVSNNQYTEQILIKTAVYLIRLYTKVFIKTSKIHFKALKGTYHSIIANLLQGIHKRYKKILIIEGLGFSARKTSNSLEIKIGFTQPKYISLTPQVTCQIVATKKIILKSTNNILLGNLCKQIKTLRKYNAYKNKGIREAHEYPLQKKRTKK